MTRAVVIGGGVIGACCALHLKEAGVTSVTLLERGGKLGAQTTSAGAGFVAQWDSGLDATITEYSMSFYHRVQEEAGVDLGVRQCGQLLPALSESGERDLRLMYDRHRRFYQAQWFDATETEAAAQGIFAPGKVRGALWQPQAYRVPTSRMIEALGQRMSAAGVEIRLGSRATGTKQSGGRVVAVQTNAGAIAADLVINAAGAWAHSLGEQDGVFVGAVPLAESRFLTDPSPHEISDEIPAILLLERDLLYLRPEMGALLVGAIERSIPQSSRPPLEAPPEVDDLPDRAVEGHERLAESSADLIPLLGRLRPRSRASGLPSFTPDGLHVLGEAPTLSGYYVVAGCNETGVTHAPGLARLLSELVTRGKTDDDISAYRVGRFDHLTREELSEAAATIYLARHTSWRAGPINRP